MLEERAKSEGGRVAIMIAGIATCPRCAKQTMVVDAVVKGAAGFLVYDLDMKKQHKLTCAKSVNEKKPCTKCRRIKPFADFPINNEAPNKLGRWCRECSVEASTEYRKEVSA